MGSSSSRRSGFDNRRKHRQPLPAAAQRLQRPLAEFFRHIQRGEHHIDAPAFALSLLSRKRTEHRIVEGKLEERRRHVLLDIADRQPARSRDLAIGCVEFAGDAAKERRLAAPVGGNEADPVSGVDDKVEFREQRARQDDAEVADIDEGHLRSLVFFPVTFDRGRSAIIDECVGGKGYEIADAEH